MLGTQPIKILRLISRFLSLDSIVCFALTCRGIYNILGTWEWPLLKTPGHRAEYRFLLTLLAKELPNYIFCHRCRILHTLKTHRSSDTIETGRICSANGCSACTRRYISPSFQYQFFQMAMKRHRLGLDHAEDFRILRYNEESNMASYKWHHESEPRIVNGHFILRTKLSCIGPTEAFWESPSFRTWFAALDLEICPYCMAEDITAVQLSRRPSNFWKMQLGNRWRTSNAHESSKSMELIRCRACPTEYQVESKNRGLLGFIFVVTKWQDLGRGNHCKDPMYLSHLSSAYYFHNLWSEPSCLEEEERCGWTSRHVNDRLEREPGNPIPQGVSLWERCFTSDTGSIRDVFEDSEPCDSDAKKKDRKARRFWHGIRK